MSGKKAKAERQAEVAATAADPQAVFQAQMELVRLDGAVQGGEAVIAKLDEALGICREALGVTKSNRKAAAERVDALQKAAAKANGTVLPEPPKAEAAA